MLESSLSVLDRGVILCCRLDNGRSCGAVTQQIAAGVGLEELVGTESTLRPRNLPVWGSTPAYMYLTRSSGVPIVKAPTGV